LRLRKGGALTADFRMLIGAGIVASFRILDLDDLSAKISERLRASWASNHARKVYDQETLKCCRRTLGAGQAVRQRHSSSHVGLSSVFDICTGP